MKFEEYRKLANLTYQELADKCKLNGSSDAIRYCKGSRYPRPQVIINIMNATKNAVTANDFVDQFAQQKKQESYEINYIKEVFNLYGISQTEVCKKLNFSREAFNRVANKARALSVHKAKMIGEAYGIDWRDFYEPPEEIIKKD